MGWKHLGEKLSDRSKMSPQMDARQDRGRQDARRIALEMLCQCGERSK
jgi:hypothetical protein